MASSLVFLVPSTAADFLWVALVICLIGGWLTATLLARPVRGRASTRSLVWIGGSATVASLTVWTTHYVAILGFRPDIVFDYDSKTIAASAGLALLLVGLPLALSARVERPLGRLALGAAAGLGIAGVHHMGMTALQGCLIRPAFGPAAMGAAIGAASLMLARTHPACRGSVTTNWILFVAAVSSAHFVSSMGTEITLLGAAPADPREKGVLMQVILATATVLLVATLAAVRAARRFEAQERAHSAVLATALDNMSNGLLCFDAGGRLQLFNRRYLELYRLSPGTIAAGMTPDAMIAAFGRKLGWPPEREALALARFREWVDPRHERSFDYAPDEARVFRVEVRAAGADGTVITFDDVTREREARHRAEEMALVDPLTRLGNRRAFQGRLEDGFARSADFTLLLIDLDRFKAINDSHGHATGDRLLLAMAERVGGLIGPASFAARLGGDELAVIVRGDERRTDELAEAILRAAAEPFHLGDVTVSVSCSIGLCAAQGARDTTQLLQMADIALYTSKHEGRGRATFYRPGMLEAVAENQTIEADLRTALEAGEFHLAYQPILNLSEDRIVGFEALLRWDHPTRGNVSPARFIPIAEESGQIVPIGRWILEEACREAARWGEDTYVAVNVSPVQLSSPRLLGDLTRALAASGLPPYRLEIELTETAIVEDGARIADVLRSVAALGVKIAMDDFGTGYSSLGHLREFPLDRLKIDRSFVMDAHADERSKSLLAAIIQIGNTMNIATTAEGVETPEQFETLRGLGCTDIQGYLVGRPQTRPSFAWEPRRERVLQAV
ncbi:EAL domain-containing protein [Aureimonas sp. ME7]|uniref:putative bifunctional diguanylate cyclase/phosphodiesterase n=1 Tax=Aureimonas sp. ME7 TaxID=2744252 RepID=UPI0015F35D28|nr:EAL domain-containing protein [Aureimonas sp. ME7]